MQDMLEQLLIYCAEDGRICPVPIKWNEFWKGLKRRSGERRIVFADTLVGELLDGCVFNNVLPGRGFVGTFCPSFVARDHWRCE